MGKYPWIDTKGYLLRNSRCRGFRLFRLSVKEFEPISSEKQRTTLQNSLGGWMKKSTTFCRKLFSLRGSFQIEGKIEVTINNTLSAQ